MGRHNMMRRMDRHGDVLIWCRKCSGYARQRMEAKLMNCCKPDGHQRLWKDVETNSGS